MERQKLYRQAVVLQNRFGWMFPICCHADDSIVFPHQNTSLFFLPLIHAIGS
jgi:hypothetical protein